MEFNFNNKRVFISGGTKGIGKKIVENFLDLGANVITCGRSEIDNKIMLNSNFTFLKLDLSAKSSVNEIISKLKSSLSTQ